MKTVQNIRAKTFGPGQASEVIALLDKGLLYILMQNGNYWRLHRNGKTQFWKRRPQAFRVPCKAGLRSYFQLTQDSMQEAALGVMEA